MAQQTAELLRKVGHFAVCKNVDGEIIIHGPESYMKERGNDRLRKIEAGQDIIVNSAPLTSDLLTTVLVSLQTDYAGWKGEREMAGWMIASAQV